GGRYRQWLAYRAETAGPRAPRPRHPSCPPARAFRQTVACPYRVVPQGLPVMTTPVSLPIAIRGLSKSFGTKEVLRGIDLELPPGTVLGLLGSNGAGKTTLIKCLLGLLAPTSGQAAVFGENAWDLSAEAKARLGYVPQEVATYP